MADGEPWKLSEDGYLNAESESKSVICHPNLNVILLVTNSDEVLVIDVNSGCVLQRSSLSANWSGNIQGTYLPGPDKLVLTDGCAVGARSDYNGVLFLDTILQPPLHKPDDVVKLELLCTEALLLQRCLRQMELPGVYQTAEVLQELSNCIKEAQAKPKKSIKSQKWSTICLELPHSVLKPVCTGLVTELKRQNRNIPVLPIVSALIERLNSLLPCFPSLESSGGGPVERSLMYSEAARRETFSKWPHMNYKWALPDQMAQAGFYHQPNSAGDDRAMCFTCIVCLVCWEATDEPWSEHERHSPTCPFVKGEYTQNVPISVTYATAPAMPLSSSLKENLPDWCRSVVLGTSSVPDLTVTLSSNGVVNIWNVKRQIKREASFCVSGDEPLLLQKLEQEGAESKPKPNKSWKSEQNSREFLSIDQKSERDQSDCDLYADVPKPPREAWLRTDVDGDLDGAECPVIDDAVETFVPKNHLVELTAASVVGGSYLQRSCASLQPVVVVGVEVTPTCTNASPLWGGACDVVRIMNSANQASSCDNGSLDIMKVSEDSNMSSPSRIDLIKESSVWLVVYEYCPHHSMDDSDDEGGNNSCDLGNGAENGAGSGCDKTTEKNSTAVVSGGKKKYLSGTGTSASTSGTRQENNMYQDIFLPKYLYDAPVIQDGEGSIIISGSTDGIIDHLEFSPTTSMLSPPDYALNMLQMTLGGSSGGGTSIISHPILNGYLGEVKKSSSKKDTVAPNSSQHEVSIKNKFFEPIAVQCVPLPAGYKIHSIHPTKDGGHLLIVLTNRRSCGGSACDGATFMDIDGDECDQRTTLVPSIILLLALDLSSDVIRINEIPVLTRELEKTDETPIEVNLLPLPEREDTSDFDECETEAISCSQPSGLASIVCADGKLRILDVGTLRFVAEAHSSGGAPFVSATYCSNLERICACTEKGSLHFFPLRSNEFGMLPLLPAPTQPQPSTSSGQGQSVPLYSQELLINSPLRLSVLHQLMELTKCENLTPCYAATFPPCWSEMMQAQKQRRHPQHLQQGDDAQHTRTWKLQRDATTWDEHVFEITLPKSCTVGHVCFKFSFHSTCSPPPNIQVTLLKQNVSGIGHKQPTGLPVDNKVDFGLGIDQSNSKEFVENPVTSEEYLRAHNAEILCGPVNLAQCLDLSDQGGSLILTSPKLLRTRSRTLQLHLKAVSVDPSAVPKTNDEKPSSKKTKIDNSAGSSSSQGNTPTPNPNTKCVIVFKGKAHTQLLSQMQVKKAEIFLGCDWLQEVSIAIRRTKQTTIQNERNQRCAMLESNSFIERLFGVVCLEGPDKTVPAQELALDLLCWVITIRLNPHTSGGSESFGKLSHQQSEVGRIIKCRLSDLIQRCFILGGRSIAHKCLRLILVCIEGLKAIKESDGRDLEISVLEAVLEWLPAIGAVKSAGAWRWFLMLLKRVGPFDTADIAANECVSLLTNVAQELSSRCNPYHLLLRSRFGVYGMPFEPELFDVDPPVAGKASSMPITYASVLQGEAGISSTTSGSIFGLSSGQAYEPLDLRELLAMHASLSSDKLFAALNSNNPLGADSSPGSSGACQTSNATVSGTGANVNNTSNNSLLHLRGLFSSSHFMKGLLEVEPLHYTCHAASDGTKLEKIEPGCGCTIPVSNFISLGTSGSKKADGDFDVPDIKWEEMQSKMTQLNHMMQSKLNSIIHGGEQGKPLGLLSQEGESSSTSSSQQSSSNSSPWLPQYVAPDKTPSPTHTTIHPVHCKPELEGRPTCEESEVPSCSSKKQNVKKNEEDLTTLLMPWQQLLVSPPQQTVVIERMHSGARRFVVLDFGAPVMLTDMIVPACSDLLLLSVDVWLCCEEQDGQRLVVASDIGTKALVLSDLQPPPICRYLKITTIGRYGMTTTRCKIPIGSFFGHTMILPGECPENSDVQTLSESNAQAQMGVLGALLEDIHCRYALACSRLRELLSPLLQNEISNAAHMHCYLQRTRDADRILNLNLDNQKVLVAYQECITFQHQLNVVRSVMARLETAYSPVNVSPPSNFDNQQHITQASTDKLRVLGEGLLDVLLYLGCLPRLSVTMERSTCEQLFYWLCVGEDTRMQLSAATLLVRLCGKQHWWGQFLADTVANLFSSNNTMLFPQDRVFILLAYLGRKSLALPSLRIVVLDAILGMFGRLLEPLSSGNDFQPLRTGIDLTLIGWTLLFVSQCLDVGPMSRDDDSSTEKPTKEQGHQSRWDFIQGEVAMQKRAAVGASRHRGGGGRSKRITTIHKGSIHDDFEAAKKAFQASTQALSVISSQAANISSKLDMALKQQELHFKKTMKHNMNHWKEQHPSSLRRIDATKRSWAGGSRRNPGGVSSSSDRTDAESGADARDSGPFVWLPQSHCLPVARGLIALILHMDFTCNIDMFLLACKVLARIVWCSRPALSLGDLMSDAQLMQLVHMVVWQDPHQLPWGGPWATHAITCLLQDILEGVRSNANGSSRDGSPSEDAKSTAPPYRTAYERMWGSKGPRYNAAGSSSSPSSSSAAAPSAAAGPSSSDDVTTSFDTPAGKDTDVSQPSDPSPSPSPAPTSSSATITVEAPSPTPTSPIASVDKPGTSASQTDSVVDLLEFISKHPSLRHEQEEMIAEDCPDAVITTPGPEKPSTMVVLESDDSELEDFLDDILEHGRSLLKRGTNARTSIMAPSRAGCISTAMDARLDFAVDCHAEVMIRRLTILSSYNLTFSVNSMFSASERESSLPPPPVSSTPLDNEPASSLNMLINCFDKIFKELQFQGSCNSLESVLQLWLSLNMETSYDPANQLFDASSCPVIVVSPSAVSGLISALSWQPEMSVRAWSLAFQCLTQISNTPFGVAVDKWGSSAGQGMANVISSDHQFVTMLLRFLSGSGINSQCSDVGPTVCGAMRDLLVRLMIRTDVGSSRKPSGWMSSMLLRLSHQLIGPGGAVACRRGPLDAQCTFFSLLLGYNFSPATVDVDLALSLLESVGVLVHTFVLTSEKVRSRSVSETNQSSSMCFGGLLSHVIGGELKPPKSTSWDSLVCSILRLACNLVQARLNRDEASSEAMELSHAASARTSRTDVSQTDEHKAKHGNNTPSTSPRNPFLADTLLQRQASMMRLLGALAGCTGSPLAVLLGTRGDRDTREPRALANVISGEPLTVGDGIFHLLLTLHRKASHPKLLLQPLFDYLSSGHMGPGTSSQSAGALHMSEPLLWFLMKVLDNPEILSLFDAMGGTKMICENLVHSSRVLVSSHPSLVSVVMQHLCRASPPVPSITKKPSTAFESFEGFQNFAPLGTITSSSTTAQPADVLIQSTPSHRRARAPAWSYHFYPDELYLDLTLRLPCAILLREVHLQPHLTSLATCPSAVGLEVSRDGSSPLVPICAPMSTSGTTYVRLTLDRPEVVTSVLLRLYRPHDSANIGLSQIRLLGSTTFGEATYRAQNWDVPEEEHLTKTSLGWLRLLHHCLTGAGHALDALVASAAQVPGLLDACGGLLLLPAPVPALLTTALEFVLLRLGLHSRELGLRLLDGLLRSPPCAQIYVSPTVPTGPDSVVDLLFSLGTTRDANTRARLETMLAWLQEMAAAQKGPSWSAEVPPRPPVQTASAACVHSIAAVLWDCHRGGVDFDLAELISYKLFMDVYQWSLQLPSASSLKTALDALLCSMCSVQPYLFSVLLQTMGAVPDDSKDMDQDSGGPMTDDRKEAMGAWSRQVNLSEGQLMTIAMAAQSSAAVHHLLDSGLPNLLAHSLLVFCLEEQEREYRAYPGSSSLTDADKENSSSSVKTMSSILKLFAELCSEGQLRDWLGSVDGSVFWLPLLRLLCSRSSQQSSGVEPESHVFAELETATLQFLSRCCSCHPNNQTRLATVLCDVISQQETRHHNVTFLHGVSGFARRLVLQLLLESEKLRVLVHADFPLPRVGGVSAASGLRHPSHGVGHSSQLLLLSAQTTCADIIRLIIGNNNLGPLVNERSAPDGGSAATGTQTASGSSGARKNEVGLFFSDPLSFAAAVTAKDKRSKDVKNSATRGPFAKKTRISGADSSVGLSAGLGLAPERWLEHPLLLPGVPLPGTLTLAQLLVALRDRGFSLCAASIELKLKQSDVPSQSSLSKDCAGCELTSLDTLQTCLQVFSAQGGLALLAQHLPLVYPETLRYAAQEKAAQGISSPDAMDSDWVKVDGSHIDLYEDMDDPSLIVGSSSSHNTSRPSSVPSLVPTSVPPHSLAAFGLFLRLPGYAEVLLRDRKKAQCLLRLVLGVSDDGEGGDIFSSPVAASLPTLPFQVLRQLLDATPLHTDDGVVLRRTAMDIGAIHLLLACLSVFTHQSQDIHLPGVQHELVIAATKASTGSGQEPKPTKSDDKSQLYWAKGTGFGTGSTAQSWNVEQALMRQRSEEEHVTVLLQAVSSCLNPGDSVPASLVDPASDTDSDSGEGEAHADRQRLPPQLPGLLQRSCLLPAICSYLRNDSVLDMARHIPLYRAVLQVLRALAVCPTLAPLLLPSDRRFNHGGASSGVGGSESLSAACLLTKMKHCVDTYASRLKVRTKSGRSKSRQLCTTPRSVGTSKGSEDADQDEGLAQLIADIQHTAELVQTATSRLTLDDESDSIGHNQSLSNALERPIKRTLEERYLEVMQKLQFDTFEMITENGEGGYQFSVSYHFESNLRSAGDRCHPARVKRLAQETVTLSTSLPLSYSSSVYVRCDADRLDIMKVLITGPAETPYANGCFEFDVYFPPDYPNSPMLINMETTGHHTIRFNPNLYNDGKVCLSVLNTWHGRPEEKWNAQTSSFLQVLVSIQSLILVPEPYFNEPGYERSRGTPSGNQSSREYNANICQASVRWAMLEQVRNPSPCFREVIHTHFWFKKREIIKQIEHWIADMESQGNDRRNGRAISLNIIALKRHFDQLREELNKLKPPPGLEDLAEQLEAEDDCTPCTSPGASATPTTPSHSAGPAPSDGPSAPLEHSDVDTDMEMEKIVSKVCE